jgi:ComF family protein
MLLIRLILDFLFPLSDTQALVANASLESIGAYVRPKHIDEHVVALLPYRNSLVRACIIEAKFKDNQQAQQILAAVLAEYLSEWSTEHSALSSNTLVVIPVPLSSSRQTARGYNQAERIARLATGKLPDVYLDTDLLVRVRDTVPQTSLGGTERRSNLEGAFGTTAPTDPIHTYIVLDDVTTTGTTLRAAISALNAVHPGNVIGIALAH